MSILKPRGGNYVYKGENLNNLKKKLGADDAKAKKDCPEPDDEEEANNDAELGIEDEPVIEPEANNDAELYDEPDANNDAELYGVE